ncbi:hypothetical protein [Pedobacter hiemivivus]|uniref:hypothetical protein n=1 Tax=Pedobacter hiemivivus TaxID=2530454 RepID=UPI0013F16B38|nr:hypothetical protein [Pedobacter hiemivivus]
MKNPIKGELIFDKFPTEWPPHWNYIKFGTDGKLYLLVPRLTSVCQTTDMLQFSE